MSIDDDWLVDLKKIIAKALDINNIIKILMGMSAR